MSVSISVEHITKAYRLGTIGSSTLGADLARWWATARGRPDPRYRVGEEHKSRREGEIFWALNDVSFSVQPGEVVGIVGKNGAGKSTMLKILSQVTAPTGGRIWYRGRIASLLEVGTGFHPELTGRENVFLNGAILGMTVPEIRSKFDEIVAFSECEQFLDTPVKRYSSGMYVRLAFAVAAHLDPDILVVDEVLAVGDAQFQKKCLGKIRDVSGHGRTVLFVSHSMSAVAALCTRGLLFTEGRIVLDGDIPSVVAAYHAAGAERPGTTLLANMRRDGSGKGKYVSLTIGATDASGRVMESAVTGCDVVLSADIHCTTDFNEANVAFVIYDSNGYRVIDINSALKGRFLSLRAGQTATVQFRLQNLLLKPGEYPVEVWLGRAGVENMDHVENAGLLAVRENVADTKHAESFPGVYRCQFDYRETLDDVSRVAV